MTKIVCHNAESENSCIFYAAFWQKISCHSAELTNNSAFRHLLFKKRQFNKLCILIDKLNLFNYETKQNYIPLLKSRILQYVKKNLCCAKTCSALYHYALIHVIFLSYLISPLNELRSVQLLLQLSRRFLQNVLRIDVVFLIVFRVIFGFQLAQFFLRRLF